MGLWGDGGGGACGGVCAYGGGSGRGCGWVGGVGGFFSHLGFTYIDILFLDSIVGLPYTII